MSFPPDTPRGGGRLRCAALACLLLAAAPPARPAPRAWPAPAGRGLQYLEMGLGQLQRLERRIKRLGEDRQGAGALAAAALAAAGRPHRAGRRPLGDARARRLRRRWQTLPVPARRRSRCSGSSSSIPRRCRRRCSAGCAREAVAAAAAARAGGGPRPLGASRTPRTSAMVHDRAQPGGPDAGRHARLAGGARLGGVRRGLPRRPRPARAGTRPRARATWRSRSPSCCTSPTTRRSRRCASWRRGSSTCSSPRWAQEQVGGFPAGAKSRTYVPLGAQPPQHRLARLGLARRRARRSAEGINFMDWPELPVSRYAAPGGRSRELLAERRRQPPYEIKERRRIDLGERMDLDAALYSYATPDYILGTAQAVGGLAPARLGRPGDRRRRLYAESAAVRAALPLEPHATTRRQGPLAELETRGPGAWGTRTSVARPARRPGRGSATPTSRRRWSQPERARATAWSSSRAAATPTWPWSPRAAGRWRRRSSASPATTAGKQAPDLAGSWVAVPRAQPAQGGAGGGAPGGGRRLRGLEEAGRRRRASQVVEGELRFTASDGTRSTFLPGRRAAAGRQRDRGRGAIRSARRPVPLQPGARALAFSSGSFVALRTWERRRSGRRR